MKAIPIHAIPVLKRTDVDFKAWIHPEERERLVVATDYTDALYEHMHKRADGIGMTVPWEKAAGKVRFPPGVYAWTGITHHGKSTLLRFLMQFGMKTGEKVGIASFEEDVPVVLGEMVQQAAHHGKPTREFIGAWAAWSRDKLVLYDRQSMVKPEVLIGVANYCAATFGTSQFVIDSLMRLDIRSDDYDGQRELFNLLGIAAKASNLAIHVVCHARKGNDEESPLSIMDIKGANDIINQADGIIQVWRDKSKQPTDRLKADGLMIVHKQRPVPSWLGQIALWHDRTSKQFLAGSDHSPMSLFSMHGDGIPQSVKW